jgi:periplasmic divalent cation tolerance protein
MSQLHEILQPDHDIATIPDASAAPYCVVLVTAPSEAVAQDLARRLVADGLRPTGGHRLVACANLWPIQSIYRWNGAVTEDAEWQLLLKT